MRRIIALAAVTSLVLGVAATALGSGAVQGKVVLEDPLNDANFVNDQGVGDGSLGDVEGPADAGSVSDLLAVEFSNDKKNLYIKIDTEAAPPAISGIGYRVRVNPEGAGGTHCLQFEAFFPGANNNLTEFQGHLRDTCEGGDPIPVEVIPSTTIVVPRDSHDAFAKGATLAAPQAQAFVYSGTYPTGVAGPTVDTTKIGEDYDLVDKKKKKKKKR